MLNRPEARNALSTEMLSIMVQAWDRVDNDPEIRSCVLTGSGGLLLRGHGSQGRDEEATG
jgi:enoyl-CoA hydratase